MNPRQKEILHILLSGQSFTTNELASRVHASERTVRNDLSKIESELSDSTYIFRFEKKPGVGVRLLTDHADQILKDLIYQRAEENVYETTYRRDLLLFRLLAAPSATTLNDLGDSLYVNKQIIREDLLALQPLLQEKELSVTIKPKIGVRIIGSEIAKRDLLSITLRRLSEHSPQQQVLEDFFSKRELTIVNELIARFEKNHQLPSVGQPMNSIAIHLLFMLIRVKEKETIQLQKEELQMIQESRAYRYAQELTTELTHRLGLVFPTDEVGYLALRIAAFYVLGAADKDDYHQNVTKQIDQIIATLIDEVRHVMGYDLSNDTLLKKNLHLHLEATFTRIASGFHIANPLKSEILRNYTQLFLILQSIAEEVASDKSWTIPEEEIAYLTVHVQGAVERLKEKHLQNYKTVIVCDFGIGVSAFIEAKLMRVFSSIDVLALLSVHELDSYPLESIDFVLSTVSLESKVLSLPVLTISPLFEAKDQAQLSHFLVHTSPKQVQKRFDISQFSHPFLVHPQLHAETQEAVLDTLLQQVIQKGYATDSYRETVLARETRSSTRVGARIALPHGDPQEINHSFIAIATLNEPIPWGTGQAQFIALIGLNKQELGNPETKKFFSVIHDLDEHPEKLDQLLQETNPLEILTKLSQYQ